jgi:hypothetical protein
MMEAEVSNLAGRKGPGAGRKRQGMALLGALALAVGVGVLSTGCGAAEILGPARPNGVPEVLASVTVLSDAAMANEKGAGLQSAAILNDTVGHGKVLLWDELKAPPQLAPATDTTINTGGK